MTQNENIREVSLTSTLKNKEKYDKSLNTQRFKSKLLDNHLIYNEEYTKPITQEIANDKTCLLSKEKLKTLTLINSKQNERMCIHINYQPHNSSTVKSKLTIHKESLVNIRPQLTKHTFTTATCQPQRYSSKPNISTQYLVHLDEGGCKEIKPETEEIVECK